MYSQQALAAAPQHDYFTTFSVGKDAATVLAAITNVRGWWSENIDGPTDRAGQSFHYRFQDLHRATIGVDEVAADRVSWTVTDNYFSFTADAAEWAGTRIIFDIVERDGQTVVNFTHAGLVPSHECYDACSDGWRTYINGSLKSLIETGAGMPNKGEAVTESEQTLAEPQGHRILVTTDAGPEAVYAAIVNPQSWWEGEYTGETKALGDRFTYVYKTFHSTTQEITEAVPGRRVVWNIVASHLSFVADHDEWTGTRIVFDIEPAGTGSRLTFTHEGLTPALVCFEGCSGAWDEIIGKDLKAFLDSAAI